MAAPHDEGELPRLGDVEARVVAIVRAVARETGGTRAESAVAPGASLERQVGLGSLERVELLSRLERAFGRTLDDRALAVDTPTGLARVLLESETTTPLHLPPLPADRPAGAATDIGRGVLTLHESLFRHARLDPGRVHVFLQGDDGADEPPLTYGRLWDAAAAVAGGLVARGVRPGQAVALMLPTGFDFLRAFAGIVLARAVPVPIYPPMRLDRLEEYAQRQSAILGDAAVVLLVTVDRARPIAALLARAVPTLTAVVSASELAAGGAPTGAPEGRGADPAFIQYTSGSTGQPKGVLLTHDNLLANIRAIAAGLQIVPTDVGASWLPLYHDMGLIGSWLCCLHLGIPLALLPPTSFLARPERWLWTIHRRRATLSPAPNFAYELCARRVPDEALEGLDLSSWRIALNGAEPVSRATVDRFVSRFAPLGFRREAMMPVYGLAESSVALCFPPVGRGPRFDRVAREPFQREGRAVPATDHDKGAVEFVSAGRELPGHEVRIVDESGADAAERVVGRLVFRGPSTMSGYHGQPEATAAITLDGGWLDSGDLAYRAAGEIYVCGRRKDLIIKGGRNLVPQEIEEAAAGVEGIRRGCVVALGVPSATLGTESLLVVAETRAHDPAERERIATAVTAQVADAVGVPPDEVLLVGPGAVPKTTSGKVRRAAPLDLVRSGTIGRTSRTTLARKAALLAHAVAGEVRPVSRAAVRVAYASWLALAFPMVVLPAWLLVAFAPTRRLAFAVARGASRAVLRVAGCRLGAIGLDHLPTGAHVLASNHASYADVLALLALLPEDFLFVAKREVLRYPVVGTVVRRCGHLTVDRSDAQQSVADADAIDRALRGRGERVLFFPEATFTAATGLRPFRLGAFRAAAAAGVPVVPLALRGTRQMMRGALALPRPSAVSLLVGEPIAPEGTELADLVRLRDRVADAIAASCGEPRLDLVAGGLERPAQTPPLRRGAGAAGTGDTRR
jgi:fatty-acyl-CoA synthase